MSIVRKIKGSNPSPKGERPGVVRPKYDCISGVIDPNNKKIERDKKYLERIKEENRMIEKRNNKYKKAAINKSRELARQERLKQERLKREQERLARVPVIEEVEVSEQNNYSTIYKEKYTGVYYACIRGSVIPLLNKDGKPLTYMELIEL